MVRTRSRHRGRSHSLPPRNIFNVGGELGLANRGGLNFCYSEADMKEGYFQQVYRIVRAVPRGQVTTYGRVAALVGRTGGARTVGWAMRALGRGSDVPRHRVMNAQGRSSLFSRIED